MRSSEAPIWNDSLEMPLTEEKLQSEMSGSRMSEFPRGDPFERFKAVNTDNTADWDIVISTKKSETLKKLKVMKMEMRMTNREAYIYINSDHE